jgi:four helix bundle protein
MNLVEQVYGVSRQFPVEEKFGLVSQMRRSAVSIPSNIAEGAARKGNNENIQFIYVALGSLAELETQAMIAHRLGYIDGDIIQKDITTIRMKILNYLKYLKTL